MFHACVGMFMIYPHTELHIVTCMSDYRLVIGFIELLQNVTTNNNGANTNSHTLQFITARTKSSQSAISSPAVAW
jgi:hypothetical protein